MVVNISKQTFRARDRGARVDRAVRLKSRQRGQVQKQRKTKHNILRVGERKRKIGEDESQKAHMGRERERKRVIHTASQNSTVAMSV